MEDATKTLNKVIRIDESERRGHLDEMVSGTVEETLNAMLEAEADDMCNAQRYEPSPDRGDTRAGSYKRKLHTKAGEVEAKAPKLRKQTFEKAIIVRYRRRDVSIEETIVQMYLAGVSDGHKEEKAGWRGLFLKDLAKRGVKGVRLIISDACIGLAESAAEVFPEADWQRCTVHFYRNIFSHIPRNKMREVAAMLKAIHAQENREAAERKSKDVVDKLRTMKLKAAAGLVEKSIIETFAYFAYPPQHWLKIRTNNPMERLLKEARRRTKVVGAFPGGNSALMRVSARLRYVSTATWGTRKYMKRRMIEEMDNDAIYSAS